jgi:plasmid maintenance system antidote protein VapI
MMAVLRRDGGSNALRAEGLTISDTAAVLGVSRGRVAHLVKKT